ncbi:MAG: PcfJ domain-containing protein [Kofleriaceae bacterium]
MSTLTLRRHHRRLLDHVLHRAHAGWAEPAARSVFVDLLGVVRARSDLLAVAPTIGGGGPRFDQVDALINLARWWREVRASPTSWPGRSGHPLVVIDDLQRHLFGLYPTPRFLARVWFPAAGDEGDAWRGRLLAYGRGTSLRKLGLPIALTRGMARHFIATADEVPVSVALRRAQVLGLGGSPALARAVAATRLGRAFVDEPYWRAALAWLAARSSELPIDQVASVIDYLEQVRAVSPVPPVVGRTVASLLRQSVAWQVSRGRVPVGARAWVAAGWAERDEREAGDGQAAVWWHVVELRDAAALALEGHALRHCVYGYRFSCQRGRASIWSLRRSVGSPGEPGRARAVATIEVEPRTGTIVQLRGRANRPVRGPGVDVIRRWAVEAGLTWSACVLASLADEAVTRHGEPA